MGLTAVRTAAGAVLGPFGGSFDLGLAALADVDPKGLACDPSDIFMGLAYFSCSVWVVEKGK